MQQTEPSTEEEASYGEGYADERAFHHLVANSLLSNVAGTFLWFALTFWVYLETKSVVATGVIGGSFGLASAVLGPWFGTYVDHHRKHAAMMLATTVSTAWWGMAPWPPVPRTLMMQVSPLAMAYPGTAANLPSARPGMLCMPNIASHGNSSRNPSSSILRAPARPSSAG